MALITVKGSGTDLQPGAYEVTLTALEGPRTIIPQSGPNAGQEIEILDWTFHTEDGQPIEGTTSTASGPRSKLYAWLTALLGGVSPATGQQFEPGDLVGRMAIATIELNDAGWPRIAGMSAIPKRSTPAATSPAAQARAKAATPAQPAADLPF